MICILHRVRQVANLWFLPINVREGQDLKRLQKLGSWALAPLCLYLQRGDGLSDLYDALWIKLVIWGWNQLYLTRISPICQMMKICRTLK